MHQPGQRLDLETELNQMTPLAKRLQLGTFTNTVITKFNEFHVQWDALLTKIDADNGGTDTNYVELLAFTTSVPTFEALERAGAGPNLEDELNSMNPSCYRAKLGTVMRHVITGFNDFDEKYNALLAKIDADTGGLDDDYSATLGLTTLMPTLAELNNAANTLDLRAEITGMSPAASRAKLGEIVHEVITVFNEFNTVWNAFLLKIDADTGSLESDYAATLPLITEMVPLNRR